MPPKLKTKGKTKGKGKKEKKGKKGKKVKKEKPVIDPPPLHELTELYNQLRDKLFDLKKTQVKSRKKRLEGWFMTREILSLKHDNEVYHDHLKEKMEDIQRLMEEITIQLEKERAEVERLIRERMSDYDKKLAEYKYRTRRGETQMADLKIKLLEYEPLIKELGGLMARLKELQAQIPGAQLENDVKTRHLKTQYLEERSKLHNHLESELFNLIATCRGHLMPILADNMNHMELENKCNRWDLAKLDVANSKLTSQKEELLEKRNRLNIEKGYLGIDWAFNKLHQAELRRREEAERKRAGASIHESPPECELSLAFKDYLGKRVTEERKRLRAEARAEALRKEREGKAAAEKELEAANRRATKAAEAELKMSYEEYLKMLEDEEMEYYEDEDGNIVVAPKSRMKAHRELLEGREQGSEEEDEEEEASSSESSSSSESDDGGEDDAGSRKSRKSRDGSATDFDSLDDDDKDGGDKGDDLDADADDDDDDDDDDASDDKDSDSDDSDKKGKGGAKGPKPPAKAKGKKK